MESRKICLTRDELLELCFNYMRLEKVHGIMTAEGYINGIFKISSNPEKVSFFTKFINFIDKKADSFFMVFLVATIFLLMKIAIEAYFLSIK